MKKITLTAIRKAVRNHYGLNELKEVFHDEYSITLAKKHCLIKFELIGKDKKYLGWSIEGYASYILCDWLNEIVKYLERECQTNDQTLL